MALGIADAMGVITDDLLVGYQEEKRKLDWIDQWWRWDHEKPHTPPQATSEYQELIRRAMTPWLGLVVTSVAQSLYVDGYRGAADAEDLAPWRHWQDNRMDGRQMAVHRAALAYGYAYVTVLPGTRLQAGPSPVIRGVSPRRMIAAWEDPAGDEWPVYALEVEPTKRGDRELWKLRFYDDALVRHFECSPGGPDLKHVRDAAHGAGVCPVIRFANDLDLEGRTPGEVEPNISVAGRIDQTTFDRLVVQRFASWVVRTIAGMAKPDGQESAQAEKLRLAVEDILVAEDADTKFGSLPATPMTPFVEARDADIRDLAAVSQTPPHHLLGQMANLSAEALAAAEASLTRKVGERKNSFGESWESVLRLAARIAGDSASWSDTAGQVQWRDTESRSLAQAADALGKLAQMLGVPVELLWEDIPGWTQQKVERAKSLVEQGSGIQQLIDALNTDAPAASGEADPPGPQQAAV